MLRRRLLGSLVLAASRATMSSATTARTSQPISAMPTSKTFKGFRLVALDMDGTLLNKRHELSENSLQALRSLSERGVIVALCSGRSQAAIDDHAATLTLARPLPIVAFNGALGLVAEAPGYTKTASELFTTPVPMEAVERVLRICARAGLLVQYYVGTKIHVACRDDAHVELTRRCTHCTQRTHCAHRTSALVAPIAPMHSLRHGCKPHCAVAGMPS